MKKFLKAAALGLGALIGTASVTQLMYPTAKYMALAAVGVDVFNFRYWGADPTGQNDSYTAVQNCTAIIRPIGNCYKEAGDKLRLSKAVVLPFGGFIDGNDLYIGDAGLLNWNDIGAFYLDAGTETAVNTDANAGDTVLKFTTVPSNWNVGMILEDSTFVLAGANIENPGLAYTVNDILTFQMSSYAAQPTNGSTAAGNNVLHFNPAVLQQMVGPGAFVQNLTAGSTLPAHTYVKFVNRATGDVYLSKNAAGAGVASGNSMQFFLYDPDLSSNPCGTSPQIKVTSVSGGSITGFSLVNGGLGKCDLPPIPVISQGVTGGTGGGALFRTVYQRNTAYQTSGFYLAMQPGTTITAINRAVSPQTVTLSLPLQVAGGLSNTVAIKNGETIQASAGFILPYDRSGLKNANLFRRQMFLLGPFDDSAFMGTGVVGIGNDQVLDKVTVLGMNLGIHMTGGRQHLSNLALDNKNSIISTIGFDTNDYSLIHDWPYATVGGIVPGNCVGLIRHGVGMNITNAVGSFHGTTFIGYHYINMQLPSTADITGGEWWLEGNNNCSEMVSTTPVLLDMPYLFASHGNMPTISLYGGITGANASFGPSGGGGNVVSFPSILMAGIDNTGIEQKAGYISIDNIDLPYGASHSVGTFMLNKWPSGSFFTVDRGNLFWGARSPSYVCLQGQDSIGTLRIGKNVITDLTAGTSIFEPSCSAYTDLYCPPVTAATTLNLLPDVDCYQINGNTNISQINWKMGGYTGKLLFSGTPQLLATGGCGSGNLLTPNNGNMQMAAQGWATITNTGPGYAGCQLSKVEITP